jgi:hypothetical protein
MFIARYTHFIFTKDGTCDTNLGRRVGCLETVGEGGERFVDVAELPLLPTEEGVADDAVAVDRVEGRSLAEGAQPRFDLVAAVDLAVWVGEQREGDRVCEGERPGVLEASGCECEELNPFASDLGVPLAQLREVPAAERSAEGAHEDEDDLVAAAVLAEPDSVAAGAFEAEVRRLGADGDALRFDRHQSCVTSARVLGFLR